MLSTLNVSVFTICFFTKFHLFKQINLLWRCYELVATHLLLVFAFYRTINSKVRVNMQMYGNIVDVSFSYIDR